MLFPQFLVWLLGFGANHNIGAIILRPACVLSSTLYFVVNIILLGLFCIFLPFLFCYDRKDVKRLKKMISTSKQCWTHLFAGRNTHHECLDRDRTCFNNSMCGPKMLECKFAEKVGSYKLALQFFLFVHKVVLFLNMYMFMPCNELFF